MKRILMQQPPSVWLLSKVGGPVMLTRHVHHPAVAVLHDVAGLAVDPAGRHTVDLEEARLQSLGLALSPRGRQVGQLQGRRRRGSLEAGDQYRQGKDTDRLPPLSHTHTKIHESDPKHGATVCTDL